MDEARRHHVYEVLREHLGEEAADLVMSHLPPVPWTDLLTKQDLDRAMRAQSGEIAQLRGEIAELRGSLRGEIADVRTSLHTEIADVRNSLGQEIASLRVVVARQAWIMTVGVIAAVSGAVGATAALT